MGVGYHKAIEMKKNTERVISLCNELSDAISSVMCDAVTVNGGISLPLKTIIYNNLTFTIQLCNLIPGVKNKTTNEVKEEESVVAPSIKAPGVGVVQ